MNNIVRKTTSGIISRIGTHSGTFHCDEVLACQMLLQLDNIKNAKIIRSRDPEVLKSCDIVVDVGQKFDPESNLFDHHQQSFNETFSSLRPEFGNNFNVRLSSAGLVYVFFGEKIIAEILNRHNIQLSEGDLKIIYEQIYKNLIMEIDAIDNGVPISDGNQKYYITTHLSARVQQLNPKWNEKNVDVEVQFEKARKLVGEEFENKVLSYVKTWLPARNIVKEAVINAKSIHPSGQIVELPEVCPWKDHLFAIEAELDLAGFHKFVLFNGKSDGKDDWRVMAIPIEPNSFICRKFLNKKWRGLKDLAEISGIKDFVFCHNVGFIGGARSRQGVLEMAIKSLESDSD